MFGRGRESLEELRVSDADILSKYLGITQIPCVIQSPLRSDNRPSFGLYSPDGTHINYIDFGTKDKGTTITLLSKVWNISTHDTIKRINDEIGLCMDVHSNIINSQKVNKVSIKKSVNTELKCKIREWRDYDIEYWESFGISLEWLKYAEVYPISHKIVVKDNHSYIFNADKYAYAYIEHKEDKVTIKIYQPLNKKYKWSNKHDKSVISLWTKVPEYGDKICICSSLKDALCLWANTGIPSISIQGEGYSMSKTAINELKRRYKKIYILLDNDEVGLSDGIKLAKETGFTNIILPQFEGGKDVSDLMKAKGKEAFLNIILPLFN